MLNERASAPILLVAIPCLNESATIGQVIADIPRSIDGIAAVDVLVVDDGSVDGTKEAAEQAGALVLRHAYNQGVGSAFKSAVNYAVTHGYGYMVNIDGDRQFNPKDIPLLLKPLLAEEADLVTASRFIDARLTPEMPKVKLAGNHMMSFLISSLVCRKFADVSCGFRSYSREALLHLNLHGAFTYTQETFLDFAANGMRIVEVPVRVTYYPDRKSRVAGSIITYAFNAGKIIFRGFRDYFPLRFFWALAGMCAIPAVLLAFFFFYHYLQTGKFSGYLYAGFTSGFFAVLTVTFFIIGIVTDMLVRLRVNQERILYILKKNMASKTKDTE